MDDARKDPDEIERDIERTRAELRESLEALDRRLSPERIVDYAADLVEREGGRAAEAAIETARHNPVAMGLIGSGLALLVTGIAKPGGTGRRRGGGHTEPGTDAGPGPSHADYDPRIRRTAPGLSDPEPRMAGFDERMAATERAAARKQAIGESEMHDPAIHPHEGHSHQGTGASARARRMRERMRHSAESLRANLRSGLGDLPEEARHRVVKARLAAIEAQHEVERRMRHGAEYAQRNAREHPLMLGVIAFGLGAALGASLPRTETENHSIGRYRDRMMDEADRIFREEVEKVRRVAEAAVAEGKSAVKDTLESGPPSEDDPARRVSEAAKSEAKRQKVGSVS
ncbi:DUF3618 domain-containing protein [Roseibacterium sp. SDUM158017]|uniref:DUF3618 domain-containing protein n=1 Tax=Roseicyclus salinarum TaxID=3036773 RepID=UPI002414E818|nr:DUF3618 domain-containing protein [Roseibacterium sp. SDUM158017]MDG4647807.1 DUF3618 domain-containing protein [Roseibacterium sp. SDUM158017]